MQNALMAALSISVVCAILSCYVVLKGWSLMGDAISHAVFPGVVVAVLLGIPIALGAFVAGLFCAMSVGYLKNHTRLKEDTLMGVVFAGMFAVGLVIFTKLDTSQHLKHILFGNLLGISQEMLWQTLLICALILVVMLIKKQDLLLYCFDPSHARVSGLSLNFLHYGLLILLSATIVMAIQAVGVILVVAMLISPGITSFMLCKRFNSMLLLAIITACLSSFLGVIVSYHLDSATGSTIVLLQALFFVIAIVFEKARCTFFAEKIFNKSK
ncbi:MAG: metal ABC transporter permease [Moraxella sp.]|nr:MAG: metal ABC transporter permease [Moraxella sp.]